MKKLIMLLTICVFIITACEKEDDNDVQDQENDELTLEDLVGYWVTERAEVIETGDIFYPDEDDPCKTIPHPVEEGTGILPYSALKIFHYNQNEYKISFEQNCGNSIINFIVSPETQFNEDILHLTNGELLDDFIETPDEEIKVDYFVKKEDNYLHLNPVDTTISSLKHIFKKEDE